MRRTTPRSRRHPRPTPPSGRSKRSSSDWLPLTYALNAINRSMGNDDLYPFALAPTVIEKLAFVHDRVRDASRGAQAGWVPLAG